MEMGHCGGVDRGEKEKGKNGGGGQWRKERKKKGRRWRKMVSGVVFVE